MLRNLLLLLLLFSASGISAQDTVFVRYNKEWSEEVKYVTDTLIFSSPMHRDFLIGTTLIPSGRRYSLIEYGLYPQKVEFTECSGSVERIEADAIENITFKDSTLTIQMKIYDNCCYSFLCDTEADEEGVLNLTYVGYGSYCSCTCCFGLTYVFYYEKEADTVPIEAVMINGNRKTLKKIKLP